MRLILLILSFISIFTGLARAETLLPEQRVIVYRDADFPGGDVQSVRDISLNGCESACFGRADCRAFTYNSRAAACFLKDHVDSVEAYVGAFSAEIRPIPQPLRDAAETRAATLDFLKPSDLSYAAGLAHDLPYQYMAGGDDIAVLDTAAREAEANAVLSRAMQSMARKTTLTDAAADWVDFARLSNAQALNTSDTSDARQRYAQAQNAAISAYLRADQPGTQVNSLTEMAVALERRDRGRDAISALRLAQSIQPRGETEQALDRLVGLYGFRITETNVESDSAEPRICAVFSENLAAAGVDYTPFLQSPSSGLAVTASGQQLCISGVEHGQRYSFTLRAGLPAASGEALEKPVQLTQYVPDRSPSVHFPGRAYVLPAAPDAGLPLVAVNAETVELSLSRVSDRNLVQLYQEGLFGETLDFWSEDWFETSFATPFWSGEADLKSELNRDVTTRLPIGEALAGQPPGLYTLQASIPGTDPYDVPPATQWFVVSDIGMTTFDGADGVHVVLRALSDAAPIAGAKVQLVSTVNEVLGEVVSDADGYAHFSAGMSAGTGSAAPAMVVVMNGDDMTFLSLSGPAFDLSDRGVEGHPAAPPIDMFLTTDRGAYRAGEVVHATALARDGKAEAIAGLPVTAVLSRPDGVEYSRKLSQGEGAGGHVFALPLAATAPRGTWRLDLFADPDAPALASTTFLVEDFLPERIDFDMSWTGDAPISPEDVPMLNLDARYLFGAPGAGLAVEGDLRLQQAREVAAWPGYRFGRYDDQMSVQWGEMPSATTDDSGHAAILPELPSVKATGVPLTARATVRVKEGSGRPVERSLTADILPSGPMIGIKPGFEDDVRENSEAIFSLIALTPDLKALNMDVTWELNRVRTRYQWYRIDGSWNWDPVTTRERVSTGTAHLGESPAPVAAQVEWGRYELVVTETGGTLSSSVDFYAGWYVPADTISTPDMLEVSLDAERYAPGDTATLRIVPRTAGKALISVMSNRLIDMITVDAVAGENTVTLPVTEDWGAGAYVTATLIQPLDGLEGHTPTRALGLSYAAVDPGPHQLTARFDVAAEAAPRGPLEVVLNVDGISEGETAYATIAAVDVGILNLTSFQSPDPSDHYFGQRRLGMGIRDLYGRLIDGRSGEMGALRSGGDAMAGMRMQAPPPTEELMAQFSGPITVVDGKAVAQFDLPEFNGTVRLMAVVWSKTGLGNASEDVLVRDPVVMTATLPRFLAPGDEARMLLELTHATGPTGEVQISASSDALADGRYETSVMLGDGETARLSVPITAPEFGLHQVKLLLATPDGTELTKTLNLPVELLDPEVSTTTRLSLAPGESFTLTDDLVAGLSAPHVSLTAGPLARIDAAGLITMLDRYPYGCTEQQTSRAMPLLYLGGLAQAMGIAGPEDVTDRIAKTITGVLANQAASGSFGLWRPSSGDLWLDAYVTDFLSRARAEGYQVPDTAFRSAMDNLRNQVNYYPDFEKGGSDLAYALYVLAREGAAAMGDLRYYADVKPEAFTTPLGSAQIGGALAAYGDQQRADRMFAQASRQLADEAGKQQGWRDDYGTDLRDAAGILALAAEAGSNAVDRTAILSQLARSGSYLSTQEATWSLLAARALIGETAEAGLELDGNALTDPMLSFANAGALAAPHVIENGGDAAMDLTITSYGVPDVPPAAEGNGYNIQRRYFTMEGDPVDIAEVAQATRLVTLISVTPWTSTRARLMINDPLPAGFEIDNPNLLRAGDIRALDWLDVTTRTETTEFRQDRFLAAVNWGSKDTIRLAYIVRAVTPGSFRHPAASVEDMYRPTMRAHGEAGRVVVTAE